MQIDIATKARVNAGWQCPECYGPWVETQKDRFDVKLTNFVCVDCGCQWGADRFPIAK